MWQVQIMDGRPMNDDDLRLPTVIDNTLTVYVGSEVRERPTHDLLVGPVDLVSRPGQLNITDKGRHLRSLEQPVFDFRDDGELHITGYERGEGGCLVFAHWLVEPYRPSPEDEARLQRLLGGDDRSSSGE